MVPWPEMGGGTICLSPPCKNYGAQTLNKPKSFKPPRKIRVFAFDPATSNLYTNRRIRELTITIPWELDPEADIGPSGEYIEVVDFDPASGTFYTPIDLNDPKIRFSDGIKPSEENPKFHQQMVYAVCMETIGVFESVLGRRVLWAPHKFDPTDEDKDLYVKQLRIYPHALREANAFYEPEKKALLFGYFTSSEGGGSIPPNSMVFTCLSHDIIVHEICHAILDGIHPRFIENSNPDMLALHEAFSDIVAIFQHFSHAEVLEDQIARTRGDLEQQSLLGALAQEFGQAMGHGGGLRDALGEVVEGQWKPRMPDNTILKNLKGPHARGSILVAAVFRAFLSIYNGRVEDLIRIASNGSGILRNGEIDPDLVKRLSIEAAKSAQHILRMCIRAMDYVPPVDVDFGDYLRAIITADHDLYPDDEKSYRLAFIEAFTAWGITPRGISVVTENSLIWPEFRDVVADLNMIDDFEAEFTSLVSHPEAILEELNHSQEMQDNDERITMRRLRELRQKISNKLNETFERKIKPDSKILSRRSSTKQNILNRDLLRNEFDHDREVSFLARNFYAQMFWGLMNLTGNEQLKDLVGITSNKEAPLTLHRSKVNKTPKFQVTSVRMASRTGKRGQTESEYVVEIVQSRDGFFDKKIQSLADKGKLNEAKKVWKKLYGDKHFQRDFRYRCGCTLLIDARTYEIRRVIRTRNQADDDAGLDRLRRYLMSKSRQARNAFDGPNSHSEHSNAFADLHRHVHREHF